MDDSRLVVVKRLREEHANDETIREMFRSEARLAARLNHPNVIQTFEAGAEGLATKLRDAESALRRAASKGIIPKRRASRLVSRLHKAANRSKS